VRYLGARRYHRGAARDISAQHGCAQDKTEERGTVEGHCTHTRTSAPCCAILPCIGFNQSVAPSDDATRWGSVTLWSELAARLPLTHPNGQRRRGSRPPPRSGSPWPHAPPHRLEEGRIRLCVVAAASTVWGAASYAADHAPGARPAKAQRRCCRGSAPHTSNASRSISSAVRTLRQLPEGSSAIGWVGVAGQGCGLGLRVRVAGWGCGLGLRVGVAGWG